MFGVIRILSDKDLNLSDEELLELANLNSMDMEIDK